VAVRADDVERPSQAGLQRLPHSSALTGTPEAASDGGEAAAARPETGSPSATPGWWYDVFLRGIALERTEDDLAFLARVLPPAPARILDVACGLGRHMRGLAALGYDCIGLELNGDVAAEARAAGLDVRTLDMRDLDRLRGRFDAVISMWSSVGWFDEETNAAVFRLLAGKVAPDGVLVVEVFNREFFESLHGPFEIRPGIVETKRLEGDHLYVEYDRGGAFRWRLYEPDELATLTGLELGSVERSAGTARMRVVLQASPASSGASAAAPITSDATVR
jgi:SAM-dependent methyltransferase